MQTQSRLKPKKAWMLVVTKTAQLETAAGLFVTWEEARFHAVDFPECHVEPVEVRAWTPPRKNGPRKNVG